MNGTSPAKMTTLVTYPMFYYSNNRLFRKLF